MTMRKFLLPLAALAALMPLSCRQPVEIPVVPDSAGGDDPAVVDPDPVFGGGPAATASESFGREGLLEAPQYTKPPEFRGMKVPEVLLSGDHAKIEAWRKSEARRLTALRRPDLAEVL